jgi:hypothetical protein
MSDVTDQQALDMIRWAVDLATRTQQDEEL